MKHTPDSPDTRWLLLQHAARVSPLLEGDCSLYLCDGSVEWSARSGAFSSRDATIIVRDAINAGLGFERYLRTTIRIHVRQP